MITKRTWFIAARAAALSVSTAFLLNGCSGTQAEYQPSSIILPPNIKSIAVRPLANQTSQPGIESKLWLAITDEFIRDGRIRYSDKEDTADGVVIGTITQYRETELSHDVNLVPLQYQIWVVMDLKFLDRTTKQYLWDEPRLEQKLSYFTETSPGGMTVEAAREELWSRYASDVVRRTLDGFGSVTGSSPRAVPKDTTPDNPNPPPTYPSTAPY